MSSQVYGVSVIFLCLSPSLCFSSLFLSSFLLPSDSPSYYLFHPYPLPLLTSFTHCLPVYFLFLSTSLFFSVPLSLPFPPLLQYLSSLPLSVSFPPFLAPLSSLIARNPGARQAGRAAASASTSLAAWQRVASVTGCNQTCLETNGEGPPFWLINHNVILIKKHSVKGFSCLRSEPRLPRSGNPQFARRKCVLTNPRDHAKKTKGGHYRDIVIGGGRWREGWR